MSLPSDRGFNLTRWSVENPYPVLTFFLAAVALALAVVAGGYLPRRFMPYVESPMVGVVSTMPGMSAEDMEAAFSKPIEERLAGVAGVRYIRSTSQHGFSIVSLEFPYGHDMTRAVGEVQALLAALQPDLPDPGPNVRPPWVLPIDPLNLPILTLSLTGDGRWSMPELRDLADNEVVNRLKAASPDVYAVGAFGGFRRELQVLVDRRKLSAQGLSILDVLAAVDRNNLSRPAGTVASGGRQVMLRVDARARDARTVEAYPIRSVGGRTVYVRDVARVVDTYAERQSGYHLVAGGQVHPGIAVNVMQHPAASSPAVIRDVNRELDRLERDYPGIEFTLAYDSSQFVDILTGNMVEELALAVALTGLVVLLFLGEWRGTLISMITIPVSLALAVLGLWALGMSLNSSTLIGLLLAIGRLVDDSIIDLHAIERHLRQGRSVREATVEGITEVRLAVAASTLVLVLALTPLLFCGGIVQLMFEGLVWPLILGLLASFLVSLTLTAVLADWFLVPLEQREREERGWLARSVLQPFQRGLDRLEERYQRLIGWLLKNRFANMVRVLVTLIIGFGFYYFIGSEMMPLADVGQGYMQVEMKPGLSYRDTEAAVARLERLFVQHPEIQRVSLEIGMEPMTLPYFNGYGGAVVNGATAMITLSDMSQRKRSIWEVFDAIHAEALKTIPEIRRLSLKEMGSDVMASSAAPIQLLVYGKDPALLSRLAEEVAEVARKTPGMHQVGTSWVMAQPEQMVQVDPQRAAALGLTVDDVARQAYYALHGGYAREPYRLPNRRQANILVRYEPPPPRPEGATPALAEPGHGVAKPLPLDRDLDLLTLATPEGGQVPLSSVATLMPAVGATALDHDGLRRVVSVTGYYRMGGPYSMDLTMEVMMKAMGQLNWPPGYGLEVRGDMTQMMDSFARLLRGLALALVFIFLVLVAQFRGFLQPAQMLFSLPLELSGVFFALWMAHQAFSTVSIMAVIVLTGMDVTTAILLIDQIQRYRARGVPRNEAVRQACPTRLRPILMTTLITIVVMLPVALFPKTGMDAYSPLGTVIVGGLLMGTVLTLVDIPIMHTLVDDAQRWWHVKVLKRDSASLPPVE